MKKLSLMFLFLLSTILVACGADTGGTTQTVSSGGSSTEGGGDGEITIALAHFNVGGNSYQTAYEKTFREYGEEVGVKVVVVDAKGDAMAQLNQMDTLISQQVDAVALWPVNGKAIVPGVKKLHDAKIPVITTNTNIDESGYDFIKGYTGPDNKTQGKYAAQLMIEALEGKGKVLEITGTPGYTTAIERTESFAEELTANSEIEVLESQPGNWSIETAQQAMENFLTKYKEGEFDGVYAHSDDMAAGIINALDAAGRKDIKVVSATLFADGYDNIKAGKQYGTVEQSAHNDAKIAVDTAIKIAKGEEIEFYNFFDTPKITIDNIDDFERPDY